ncbi:acyl-CoA dehydrogenase [Streptomyces sp. TS71-3]|uniref:acyl-CoA dehydrogenase n=1 Tax=Streptomyces sp. TS71-3 TaxID=2733862 RepID=UPI001B20297B|nr:acyl-CoA dehydrogenase [Streptomyces sp. TS71-3]GHJ36841.1 acyl-CoA dehydrogenase [Streptomyces sp. TS71-3]
MEHYKSNIRDLEFNLFEVLGRERLYGTAPFKDIDTATARTVLSEVERLAVHELSPSSITADRNPPVFHPETCTAELPGEFKRAFASFMDAEWWRLGMPEALGGTPCPPSLHWAMAELVLGANPAIWMYSGVAYFAAVVAELGTPEQLAIARSMVEGRWGTTMVLTEPDAGSDVGAGRTRAVRQEDGSWHIEGVKRFITNGEHDLAENIVHFVLARPEGHGPGTKGLSLFVVPKFDFDWDTGSLGERNGVRATNVEHKMGLKVSTTCELAFGADRPAKGWLLGEKHDGIRQMFRIIEYARMMVGTKAMSTLSTGYLNALAYARERVQGPDLAAFTDKAAPRVPITHHPDVRVSLMTQKAYAEGLRALVLYTAALQDDIRAAEDAGEDASAARGLNDLLLPLVKGHGSERSYELLARSLQILGGSGYLQDYPIEQYIRDAKIDTLYEGTTGIQGMDFFFRKIVRDGGRALTALKQEIGAFLGAARGGPELAAERDLLATALADAEAMAGTMLTQLTAAQEDPASIYKVGQNTTRLLHTSGDLVIGYLLLRHAAVALDKLPGAHEKDVPFYRGKIAVARFFARTRLPLLTAERAVAEGVTNDLMDLEEAAF